MELPVQNTPEVSSVNAVQSQSSILSPKRPSKKVLIVILLIVILIVVEVLAYLLIVEPLLQKSAPISETPTLTSAPAISEAETSEPTGVDYYVGSKSVIMNNVAGTDYSATAYRSVMAGHIFWAVHTNLPDPPEATFYQIWLGWVEGDHFRASVLYKEAENQYSNVFGFEFDALNPDFNTETELPHYILISLETEDDENIEDIILKGVFPIDQ